MSTWNIVKKLRNNWKKTVFGTTAFVYGVQFAVDKYKTHELMINYCVEAAAYGHLPLPEGTRLRRVTVVLNPAANRRKAKKNFEKYCAPLLHVAGILVDVVVTEFEGQARSLAEKLADKTDAVVVAGGDGTLSETVTGLLRRVDENPDTRKIPIGVLPLGRTNTVAKSLFCNGDLNEVKLMADATLAIIKEVTKPVDVIKIEVLETEEDKPGKPVYSLRGIEWGAFRDAHARRDKYWYWGGLRSYVSYIFTGLKGESSGVSWTCDADLKYTLPCSGCSRCYSTARDVKPGPQKNVRWWQAYVKRQPVQSVEQDIPKVDYSKVENSACGSIHETKISTVDLKVTTANIHENCSSQDPPHIDVSLGPPSVAYFDFITEGWRRENKQEPNIINKFEVKELKLEPKLGENKAEATEHWISIDSEDYEVKPIHIKLLPKKVHLFCRPQSVVSA